MAWTSASQKSVNNQLDIANAALEVFNKGSTETHNHITQGQTLSRQIAPSLLQQTTKRLAQELTNETLHGVQLLTPVKRFYELSKQLTSNYITQLESIQNDLAVGRAFRTKQQKGTDLVASADEIVEAINYYILEQNSSSLPNGLTIREGISEAREVFDNVERRIRAELPQR